MNKKVTNKTLTKRKVNKFLDGAWKNNWKGDRLGGTVASTVGGAANVAANAIQLAQPGDTSSYDKGLNHNEAIIDKLKNQKVTASSMDELNANISGLDWGNINDLKTSISHEEAGGASGGEWASGLISGAAAGAAAGSTIAPPIGTIVGTLIGTGTAALSLGLRGKKANETQNLYALNAEKQKAEFEKAKTDLRNSISNKQQEIAQNDLNNFMINKIAYGGPLFNHTGDWSNGLTFIDEGGTHEQNPFEGVMVGVDQEGTPNLVEEGEVIFGDYVFSNRLKPTKKILADGGFPDKYVDWTFAKIAEDLQKESAERPIDFISNNTLEDMMSRLINFQETVREKKKTNNYSKGGKLLNKFNTGGYYTDPPQGIRGIDYEWYEEIDPAVKTAYVEPSFFLPEETEEDILFDLANETALLKAQTDKDAFLIGQQARSKEAEMLETALNKMFPNTMPSLNQNQNQNKNQTPIQLNPTETTNSSKFNLATLGRYAPVLFNAASLINNALEKPDKLDYNHYDTAFDYAENIPVATYTPVGGKVTPDLMDPRYLLNQHAAERAALRRAIREAAPTGSTALMHLANADYNAQRNDADALLAINRENWNRKLQAAQHNFGIDTTNLQAGLQTLGMNQTRAQRIANAAFQRANARTAIDQFNLEGEAQKAKAISSSMGALSEDLAGIGTEAYWKDQIDNNPAFADYNAKMNKAKTKDKTKAKTVSKNKKMLTKKKGE